MRRFRRTLRASLLAVPFILFAGFSFAVRHYEGLSFLLDQYDFGGLPQEERAAQVRQAGQMAIERIAQEEGMTADEVRERLAENTAYEAARRAPVETRAALETLAHEATSRKSTPVAVAAYALVRALERHDCGAAAVALADLDAKVASVEGGRDVLSQRTERVHRGMALICTGDL
ncbi:hypothetical protein LZC95_18300 [Pendulispora brunnea]|uniref:Uncharacterized protein n=1 Tax=Pendulispora brunnea TaxID=2905690 RepID=A0ABZ2KP49_9BACT